MKTAIYFVLFSAIASQAFASDETFLHSTCDAYLVSSNEDFVSESAHGTRGPLKGDLKTRQLLINEAGLKNVTIVSISEAERLVQEGDLVVMWSSEAINRRVLGRPGDRVVTFEFNYTVEILEAFEDGALTVASGTASRRAIRFQQDLMDEAFTQVARCKVMK